MANEVNVTASLNTKRARSNDRNKFYVEVTAAPLLLNLDEQAIAEPYARALAAEMKRSLLAGQKLDGSPMPAPAPATIKRREYRDKQEIDLVTKERKRGGSYQRYAATQGQRDEAVRQGTLMAFSAAEVGGDTELAYRSGKKHALDKATKAARNYDRRFRALRLGVYDPKSHANNHAVGVESGMLADSFVAEPSRSGGGWQVFVTDRRSFIDKRGASPAKRVLVDTGFLRGIGANPVLKQALRETMRLVIFKRLARALEQAARTFQRTASIFGDAQSMFSLGQAQ